MITNLYETQSIYSPSLAVSSVAQICFFLQIVHFSTFKHTGLLWKNAQFSVISVFEIIGKFYYHNQNRPK